MKTAARQPVARPRSEARPRMPAALPPAIARPLRALASRVLRVAWTNGLLRLLSAFCLTAVLQLTADLLFDLPARTRALFLLADFSLFLLLAFRHGLQPYRRRLSPDDAALLAQRHWPDFKSTLISAVQLARTPNGSPWMISALHQQVSAHVARTDIRRAAPWTRLRPLFFLTLTLLLLTALLAWYTVPTSLILARRALLRNLPLPTRTIVFSVTQNLTLLPGDTVELTARAQGEYPRTGRLQITYANKPAETLIVTARPASPDTFTLTLPNVQQPFTYRFYLNDGRGPEWQATLIHVPALHSVTFRVSYPPYTGLPDASVAPGSLRLLAGSRLQIAGRASQPLQSARLLPQGGNNPPPIDLKTNTPSPSDFKGELPIPARALTGFTISLRDEQNVASRNDTLYAVDILPDAPPEITIAPGQDEKSTFVASARPSLRFSVRDDFLIQKIFLLVEPADALAEGETADPAKAQRISIALKQPASSLAFDYTWPDPEKTVKWQEGNTFYYWIEAMDNNNVTGPGITRTSVREWSVVTLKTKRDELTETLRRSADSIENLSRSQEDLRTQVGNLLKQNDTQSP